MANSDTEMPLLHQVHERVHMVLKRHTGDGDAAMLDPQQGRIDYYGHFGPALPAVVDLAEQQDWVRFELDDGDVRLTATGLQITLRAGLREEVRG